jgi:hypothetical protein
VGELLPAGVEDSRTLLELVLKSLDLVGCHGDQEGKRGVAAVVGDQRRLGLGGQRRLGFRREWIDRCLIPCKFNVGLLIARLLFLIASIYIHVQEMICNASLQQPTQPRLGILTGLDAGSGHGVVTLSNTSNIYFMHIIMLSFSDGYDKDDR